MTMTNDTPSDASPEPTTALPVPTPADIGALQERFLPLARTVDARDVQEFVGDASLVYHNVELGTRNVVAEAGRIAAELPTVSLPLLHEAPLLAQVFTFSTRKVQRHLKSPGTTAQLLKRAYAVRETLLEAAKPLVRNGLLSKAEMDRILAGRGRIDAANDCVDLAALFRGQWATLQSKTLVTEADVQEAAEVGATLQTLLHPERARPRTELTAEMKETIDLRNRFWTVLRNRHQLLWRVGAWLFGPEVDEKVPPLLSFRVVSKSTDRAPESVPQGNPTKPSG